MSVRPVFGHVIDAALATRVAAPQSFQAQVQPADGPETADGRGHVLRTTGIKPAVVSQQRADKKLVAAQQQNKQGFHAEIYCPVGRFAL